MKKILTVTFSDGTEITYPVSFKVHLNDSGAIILYENDDIDQGVDVIYNATEWTRIDFAKSPA